MRSLCTKNLIPLCTPEQAKLPTAIALGSFDGLHAGHQKVIKAITSDPPGIPTVVSFWPHPREILYSETRLRLYLPSEKTSLLAPLGVKQLVLIPFNKALSLMSAEEFIKEILINKLNARRIAVGENFRFGRNREGDTFALKQIANNEGIDVEIIPILKDSQGRMSSSRIRDTLYKGDLLKAKELMGRPFQFQGKVVSGRGIGKEIGWPTANLQVDGRKFLPGLGVYAAFCWMQSKKSPFPSVMNLGPQPTVDPTSPSAVEIHLIDQELEIRDQELLIEPIKKLRTQIQFSSLEALSSQIKLDVDQARGIFQSFYQ